MIRKTLKWSAITIGALFLLALVAGEGDAVAAARGAADDGHFSEARRGERTLSGSFVSDVLEGGGSDWCPGVSSVSSQTPRALTRAP